jgi:hypothetical protein
MSTNEKAGNKAVGDCIMWNSIIYLSRTAEMRNRYEILEESSKETEVI